MNRSTAPQIAPVEHISLVEPQKLTTPSGIPLFLLDNTNDDALKISLEFDAGKIRQQKPLVASFTSNLLLSGTSTMTSQEIEERIDLQGAYTEIEVGIEAAYFTLYCTVKNANQALRIVMEAIDSVDFNEKEIVNYRNRKKQQFQINMEKVATLAKQNFAHTLYGNSAFGSKTELSDFDLIQRGDIQNFYQEHIRKGLASIHVVGNMSTSVLNFLISATDSWKNVHKKANEKINAYAAKTLHEDKKDAVQTAIRIGKPHIGPHHSDYMEFKVLNTLLGGYFGSRLMANIREDKGYTYGIGSGTVVLKDTAYFFISTEVDKKVKNDAIHEIKKEVERLQNELVDAEELERVKKYIAGQFLKNVDGAFAMMEQFLFLNRMGLDSDFFDQYMDKINAVTPQRILQLAKEYLKWDDFSVVSVG